MLLIAVPTKAGTMTMAHVGNMTRFFPHDPYTMLVYMGGGDFMEIHLMNEGSTKAGKPRLLWTLVQTS